MRHDKVSTMKFSVLLIAVLALAAFAHANVDIKAGEEKTKDIVVDASKETVTKESSESAETDAPEVAVEKTGDDKEELEVAAAGTVPAAVSCYQCNSATTGQDKCQSNEESDLAPFLKVCPTLREGNFKGNEAKGCRKLIQNIGDEPSRIIRECAYTEDEEAMGNGRKRTGNKGIAMYYYQCENQNGQKPCNAAVSQLVGFSALFLASLVAFF
uniref:Protein sleepless n=1 Tax=Steinernema glaseri TaxID=37863 RepID=A0A1I8ARY4_9BILA